MLYVTRWPSNDRGPEEVGPCIEAPSRYVAEGLALALRRSGADRRTRLEVLGELICEVDGVQEMAEVMALLNAEPYGGVH